MPIPWERGETLSPQAQAPSCLLLGMGPHRHCRAVPTHLGAFQNSRPALHAPAGTGTRFCHHLTLWALISFF